MPLVLASFTAVLLAFPYADDKLSVEEVAAKAKASVVIITHAGRDGKRQGLGTGFVIAREGLIATNLHVIGEARPITVQLADGSKHDVLAIHARHKLHDLAILRIAAKNLTPLELGDSDKLQDGQSVVAMGNPLGLTHSVVAGVVSGRREIEGRPMIQLSMPIEQGNSGGPLLDLQGRVEGLITMKSAVTANLGFAIPSKALKPLMAKPNPIPMAQWLTIGTLDPEEWTLVGGARWRLQAGRILAEGLGSGFGGRSLCLAKQPPPKLPFEISVQVRLDDESGAAGLVFHADGGDRHYGFYPSAGELRLTRFEGPDVYSWHILKQVGSPHYQAGEWNTLRVRIEKDRFRCYVNEHLVAESTDNELAAGSVGLAKFRNTRAEFRHFRVAPQLARAEPSAELVQKITKEVDGLKPRAGVPDRVVEALAPDATASMDLLRSRAKALEQQAIQLRDLAMAVHERRVQNELLKELARPENEIDLAAAALHIARLDNEDLDLAIYRKEIDRLARDYLARLPKGAEDTAKLRALNKFLFEERAFHGSRSEYYHRANSYLSQVLEDREGLPITLSVLYMELARRAGLKVVGVGLPGHFLVRHEPAKGEPVLIDVFEGGKLLTMDEAKKKSQDITERPASDRDLAAVPKKSIVLRILRNLVGVAREEADARSTLRYLDTILLLSPESAAERFLRAAVRYQMGNRSGAATDLDWLLDHPTGEINLDRVRELRNSLKRQLVSAT